VLHRRTDKMALFARVWVCLIAICLRFGLAAAQLPSASQISAQLQNGACCAALSYFLDGKVFSKAVVPPAKYTTSQLSYWSAQEQSLNPACIVIPTTEQDVQTAVTILNYGNRAGIASCKFAVRSGGHTPQAGWANIDGGVTIDMQSMAQVVVASDKKSVTVGAGNRWGNVYPTLDDQDLTMVGGRVNPVGVGGLTTGGGVSFWSGRFGFVCDNLLSAKIVLADGSLVTASPSSHSDLFRAIKGGSSNFGIITSFTAKIFSQDAFWAGTIGQPITNKDALIQYIANFTDSATFDPYAAIICDFAWVAGVPAIIHQIAYTDGSVSWPPPSLAPLDAMPKLATTIRKTKLTGFTTEIATAQSVTTGKNNMLVTLTFVNRGESAVIFMKEVWELADETVKSLLTVAALNLIMTYQPLPHVLYTAGESNGPNVLGLNRFNDDLINLLFTVSWPLATDNARVEAALKSLETAIKAKMQEHGVANEWVYLNYAAAWQDPLRSYGQQNVNFMKGVSQQYDPRGLFQNGMPGGFKLKNV
jgi:FAD/FMN-containing dehydrogenase